MAKKSSSPPARPPTAEELEIRQLIINLAERRVKLAELSNVLRMPKRQERDLAAQLDQDEQRLYSLLEDQGKILETVEHDGKVITAFLDEQREFERVSAPYQQWLGRAMTLLKALDQKIADKFEQEMQDELERRGRSMVPAIQIRTETKNESYVTVRITEKILTERQKQDASNAIDALEATVTKGEVYSAMLTTLVDNINTVKTQQENQ